MIGHVELKAANPLTRAVVDGIADVLIDEYEGLFRAVYERAVIAIGGRPLEPADEMRNAFDHFALATKRAIIVDGNRRVPEHPDDAKVTDNRVDAVLNLWQARRHLAIGRFYCLQHQVVGFLQQVRALAAGLDQNARQAMVDAANAIDTRFQTARPLQIEAIHDPDLIDRSIAELEVRSKEVAGLARDLMKLIKDITLPKQP